MEDDNLIMISGDDVILTIGDGKIVLKDTVYRPLRPPEIVWDGPGDDVINCNYENKNMTASGTGEDIIYFRDGAGDDIIPNYEELKDFLTNDGGDKYIRKKTWRQSDNYTRQQKIPLQNRRQFIVRRRYR